MKRSPRHIRLAEDDPRDAKLTLAALGVVKPVEFAELAKAMKRLGSFWAAVNKPPLDSGEEETELPKGYVYCLGTKEVNNEIPHIYPAR